MFLRKNYEFWLGSNCLCQAICQHHIQPKNLKMHVSKIGTVSKIRNCHGSRSCPDAACEEEEDFLDGMFLWLLSFSLLDLWGAAFLRSQGAKTKETGHFPWKNDPGNCHILGAERVPQTGLKYNRKSSAGKKPSVTSCIFTHPRESDWTQL